MKNYYPIIVLVVIQIISTYYLYQDTQSKLKTLQVNDQIIVEGFNKFVESLRK